MDATACCNGYIAQISTPWYYTGPTDVCFSLDYHMYGYAVELLGVYLVADNGIWESIWVQRNSQGDRWHNVQIPVDNFGGYLSCYTSVIHSGFKYGVRACITLHVVNKCIKVKRQSNYKLVAVR